MNKANYFIFSQKKDNHKIKIFSKFQDVMTSYGQITKHLRFKGGGTQERKKTWSSMIFFWLETINIISYCFWFLISSCRAFNFADLMSQSYPNPQNSTMWRHSPMWRHSVMKLPEYSCFIINFLRWKNEVICFTQGKVMYIFTLC